MVASTAAATTTTTTASTAAAVDRKQLAGDMNRFLTLLVTQLQNQDPLNPMDTNAFTQQLVQFASVEQQIQQNSNLEKLIAAQKASQVGAMSGYVGQTIEAAGPLLPLQGGQASGTYTLSDNAAEAILRIRDTKGEVVREIAVDPKAGKHPFAWDGQNQKGSRLPDGSYSVEVVAKRRDGATIESKTTVVGRVTSATLDKGQTTLLMGEAPVAIDAILAFREKAPANPAN